MSRFEPAHVGGAMGLFRIRKPESQAQTPEQVNLIPIAHIDVSKRYDVYYTDTGHDRVYENVLFISIRTFDQIKEYSSLINGYLEIEFADGIRCLLPNYGIKLICEHGAQPAFRTLRHRRSR